MSILEFLESALVYDLWHRYQTVVATMMARQTAIITAAPRAPPSLTATVAAPMMTRQTAIITAAPSDAILTSPRSSRS